MHPQSRATHRWPATQAALAVIVMLGMPAVAISQAPPSQPYNNPGPFVLPISGTYLPPPAVVKGKQYSHNLDQAVGGVADPAQIISWDGLGGTADDGDFSTLAPPYSTSGNFQIDALANERDSLFNEVLANTTHLVYSVDHRGTMTPASGGLPFTVPSAGPLSIGGGNVIGGAGEVSYELGAFGGLPSNAHGLWASQLTVNGLPTPADVDALEIWGFEPSAGMPPDAGKYSAENDLSTATAGTVPTPAYSVWNYSAAGHSGYVLHSLVVALVQDELGTTELTANNVDLDALMVMDSNGSFNQFGAGDKIMFSIRQVPSATAGGGFLATGSELFVLDGASTVGSPIGQFLVHGGHTWDKAYALANMVAHITPPEGAPIDVQLDLDALEAVSGVPEPGSIVLLLAGLLTAVGGRFRRHRIGS